MHLNVKKKKLEKARICWWGVECIVRFIKKKNYAYSVFEFWFSHRGLLPLEKKYSS